MLSGVDELAVLEGNSVGDIFDSIGTPHRRATTNVLLWLKERLNIEGDRSVVGSILYVYALGVEKGKIPIFSLQLSEQQRLSIVQFIQKFYSASFDLIWYVLYGLMETAREGKDGSPQILSGQGLTLLDRLYNGGIADAIGGVTNTVVQSVASAVGIEPSILRVILIVGGVYAVIVFIQKYRLLK